MIRSDGLAPLPSPPIICASSRCSLGPSMKFWNYGAPASSVGTVTANQMHAIPFVIEAPTTFYKGFWVNGSSVGNNSEVGIYDASYNKIVTTGSVANSGASTAQAAALSATTRLSPGLYYMVHASDATASNRYFKWSIGSGGAAAGNALGMWSQGSITLGSLPATATPADYIPGNSAIFTFGLITRSVFDL